MNYKEAAQVLKTTSSTVFITYIVKLKDPKVVEKLYRLECQLMNRRIIREKLLSRLRAIRCAEAKKAVTALW